MSYPFPEDEAAWKAAEEALEAGLQHTHVEQSIHWQQHHWQPFPDPHALQYGSTMEHQDPWQHHESASRAEEEYVPEYRETGEVADYTTEQNVQQALADDVDIAASEGVIGGAHFQYHCMPNANITVALLNILTDPAVSDPQPSFGINAPFVIYEDPENQPQGQDQAFDDHSQQVPESWQNQHGFMPANIAFPQLGSPFQYQVGPVQNVESHGSQHMLYEGEQAPLEGYNTEWNCK